MNNYIIEATTMCIRTTLSVF